MTASTPLDDELRENAIGREEAPPASVEEALARARRHGRAALRESTAAARWLVEAASLATGAPSDERRWLGQLVSLLDALRFGLDDGAGPVSSRLLESVAEALDEEIARWEERGQEDPEARAVLRAFLGLREILWELGVRPRPRSERSASEEASRRGSRPDGRSRPDRPVQRVPVEG